MERRALVGLLLLGPIAAGCALEQGRAADPARLGYQACAGYHDCGPGRHCTEAGTCWAECRGSADCGLVAGGDRPWLCNRFGQCVEPGGERACREHADCGPGGLCNGRCAHSGAICGGPGECPQAGEGCAGLCASWCLEEADCRSADPELGCSPLGLCLGPGWERWVSPGQLPPERCTRDAQCRMLGWAWTCEPAAGRCVRQAGGPDLGAGPADAPARALRGVWGLRLNLAIETYGLPLLSRQTTSASHLLLVRARQAGADRLELDERLCDLQMINFADDGGPASDLIHVTIPHRFIDALPVVSRPLELPRFGPGAPLRSGWSLELRGCRLEQPASDRLPRRVDLEADPADPRLWDQDADGRPGMTTLADGVLRGEVYIVQRLQLALDGELLDADRAAGLVLARTEEHILSASKPALVYDIHTALHPDPRRTYFRMQRLDDEASCADLLRAAADRGAWLGHADRLEPRG